MKRLVMAIALACAISSTAFAGIVHSTDGPSPADPPPPGDMGNGGNQGSGNLDDDDGNQGAGGIALLILDWLL